MPRILRSRNVAKCPNAQKWLAEHPKSKKNLNRVLKLMRACYTGKYEGYYNRNAKFVEYKFDAVTHDKNMYETSVICNQGSIRIVARLFYQNFEEVEKYFKVVKEYFDIAKNGIGGDSGIAKISIKLEDDLEKLIKFLACFETFSGIPEDKGATDDKSKSSEEMPASADGERKKTLRAIATRKGQATFRRNILRIYNNKCVVTGCTVIKILEAAHIVAHNDKDANGSSNGFILRPDIHTLFDLGYLWICPETLTVSLSPSITDQAYRKLHGKKIKLTPAARENLNTLKINLKTRLDQVPRKD